MPRRGIRGVSVGGCGPCAMHVRNLKGMGTIHAQWLLGLSMLLFRNSICNKVTLQKMLSGAPLH